MDCLQKEKINGFVKDLSEAEIELLLSMIPTTPILAEVSRRVSALEEIVKRVQRDVKVD